MNAAARSSNDEPNSDRFRGIFAAMVKRGCYELMSVGSCACTQAEQTMGLWMGLSLRLARLSAILAFCELPVAAASVRGARRAREVISFVGKSLEKSMLVVMTHLPFA